VPLPQSDVTVSVPRQNLDDTLEIVLGLSHLALSLFSAV
jgi:hypothetical protein